MKADETPPCTGVVRLCVDNDEEEKKKGRSWWRGGQVLLGESTTQQGSWWVTLKHCDALLRNENKEGDGSGGGLGEHWWKTWGLWDS